MSKTIVILIHGKTHSGKGAFGELLENELKLDDIKNIVRCSLSTYVRNLVKDFYYEGDMDSPEAREFMAKVYEYGSKLYPYHKARRMWDRDVSWYLKQDKDNIVIVESFRERDDIKYFEILQKQNKIHNIITIKIIRPSFKIKNYINENHKSEIDLNDFKFDYEILNDGDLNDLEYKVDEFIEKVGI